MQRLAGHSAHTCMHAHTRYRPRPPLQPLASLRSQQGHARSSLRGGGRYASPSPPPPFVSPQLSVSGPSVICVFLASSLSFFLSQSPALFFHSAVSCHHFAALSRSQHSFFLSYFAPSNSLTSFPLTPHPLSLSYSSFHPPHHLFHLMKSSLFIHPPVIFLMQKAAGVS